MEFDLGSSASCSDGRVGTVVGLIADPISRQLAHIAVEPEHHPGRTRLVPIELVATAEPGDVALACSLERFRGLPEFRDVEFVPEGAEYDEPGATFAWPYCGPATRNLAVFVDRVPIGEVEIRRHEHVHAVDGTIGRVEGLVVDDDRHITHVLLQEGHLRGRKEVAIPIGSLQRIDASGIHVDLSKREVDDLPEVESASRPRRTAN